MGWRLKEECYEQKMEKNGQKNNGEQKIKGKEKNHKDQTQTCIYGILPNLNSSLSSKRCNQVVKSALENSYSHRIRSFVVCVE